MVSILSKILCYSLCLQANLPTDTLYLKPQLIDGEMHLPVQAFEGCKPISLSVFGARNQIWGDVAEKSDGPYFVSRVPLSLENTYVLKCGRDSTIVRLQGGSNSDLARVQSIYPEISVLPANLLRFHIVFSQPVFTRSLENHLSLIRVFDSTELKNALHPLLVYELGDTCATVYLDPARLKSGLKARQEENLALTPGEKYVLVINEQDGLSGNTLFGVDFRKEFRVVAPDLEQPEVGGIRVRAEQTQVTCRFSEPLHCPDPAAQMQVQCKGEIINGLWCRIDDRCYIFYPGDPLSQEPYELIVSSEIEDLAGHSFRKMFEVTGERYMSQPYLIKIPFQNTNY